ncbi:MAG: Ldh family oxidoreductase [Deltaproteobacteria bacterium]|nr:Ldh family oxidoreductase [Deltaproteobacteria bacterium]
MSDTYYFQPETLSRTVFDLCQASGSPQAEAELVSTRLLKADLTGHPSHGIIRIPMYMMMLRRDLIKPGVTPEFIRDHGPTALINGNRSYGQVGAEKAMAVAIEKGLEHGIAGVGVTNLAHIGRLADYANSASRANCLALVFTSCGGVSSLVAPFEGLARRMATNPMALGMPSDREYPVVMDLATSVFAEGKLRVMLAAGTSAPEKALLDKDGNPTTNPADFYAGGALLPLGGVQGYKGYLLNFMVEVLAGLLTGGGYAGGDAKAPFNNCTLMIVIDVEKFRELPLFKSELESMIKFLKDTPVAEGKEVLYPGEKEFRHEEAVLKSGVPLADRTVKAIQEELDRYEVTIQLADLGQLTPFNS